MVGLGEPDVAGDSGVALVPNVGDGDGIAAGVGEVDAFAFVLAVGVGVVFFGDVGDGSPEV